MTERVSLPGVSPAADAGSFMRSWEEYCRQHRLFVTAPRRAILKALLRQRQPLDAVALHQVAGTLHAATSLGTVYRFLRELHALGRLQMQTPLRGRTLWQLQASTDDEPAATKSIDAPWQDFLQQLEALGLVEKTTSAERQWVPTQQYPYTGTTRNMLQEIIQRTGYRLT